MTRAEDTLREVAAEQAGFFLVGQAREAGVDSALIRQLARRGRLERIDRGLYRVPHSPRSSTEQYHEAILWPQAHRPLEYAVISHASALELYELTDVNPSKVHITVPIGVRLARALPPTLQIHRQALSELDRETYRGVPVTTVRRTIEDTAPLLGPNLIHQAVQDALAKRLLWPNDLDALVDRFGSIVSEPYNHAAR